MVNTDPNIDVANIKKLNQKKRETITMLKKTKER
jgi:hypothetical protein